MYKLSREKRRFSPTPIVWVDEKGKETQVLFGVTQKGEECFFERLRKTNESLQEIADFLNKKA